MNATTTPFAALDERIGAINDVLNAASVLVWDSRTMMPAGGAASRGLQISTLTRVALDMLLHADTARALDTAESALPHALQNDQGAERKPPHVPADMPPADYKGEDYQLDQAVALILSGKAIPRSHSTAAAAAALAPATP